jgi:phosphoglycerate dehydrogenase-like enzyme
MTGAAELTVLAACAALYDKVDLRRVTSAGPGISLLAVPFGLSPAQQAAREQDPWGEHHDQLTGEQREAFAAADILLTLHAPARLGDIAPRVRWVHCVGSGVGHLGPARMDPDRVILTNSAGAGAASIGEFVLARILEDYKRLPEHAALQRAGKWVSSPGRTLSGETVAVVGFGAIGREVARRLRPLGVRVLAVRRSWRPGMADADADELWGPEHVDAVIGRADVVVVCAPGGEETRDLFDRRRIFAMRRGAMLINVARGTLVDEQALAEALHEGRLRSAAIDVVREEPLSPDSSLWQVPNLRISPHSASNHHDAYVRAFGMFCDNLGRWLDGSPLRNVVDLRATFGAP